MQCPHATLSSCTCPALHIFSILSHKRHNFRRTLIDIKCVFRFSLQYFSERFFIRRRTERDMIKNIYRSSRKCGFKYTWIFVTGFRKILKYQISWKYVVWQPRCFMRTAGWKFWRTDRHEVNSFLRHISNASKTAWYKVKHINTLYRHLQNFLILNYKLPNKVMSKSRFLCKM